MNHVTVMNNSVSHCVM